MEAGLREKLSDDLKESLRNHDRVRCSVIRLLMASMRNTEIARQTTLDDSGIIGVIAKETKQREESISAYKAGNRPDLVAQEEAELAILKEYLPEQVSREEIKKIAERIISEVGAKSARDKGKVMPRVIAELKGRADGREINAVVSELLAS